MSAVLRSAEVPRSPGSGVGHGVGHGPKQHKGTVPATPTCHRSKSPVSSAMIAQKMPAEPEPHTLLCGSAGNPATHLRTQHPIRERSTTHITTLLLTNIPCSYYKM